MNRNNAESTQIYPSLTFWVAMLRNARLQKLVVTYESWLVSPPEIVIAGNNGAGGMQVCPRTMAAGDGRLSVPAPTRPLPNFLSNP